MKHASRGPLRSSRFRARDIRPQRTEQYLQHDWPWRALYDAVPRGEPMHGRLSSASRSSPVNLPSTCTSAVRRTPPPGAASACTRSTVLRGATLVRVSAREDEGKLRRRPTPTPTPRAPFAHEHPHHKPPDEREQAQRPAHHAADARSCGPEGLATLRDLCARRPPVVHELLDNGPDLGHAAPRLCLIRVCLGGMHVLYPRAQVYGRGALPAAVGRMLRAPRWDICKYAHSVLLVAKSRCRIPGELRRCPLKLRGLSHKPCADPTRRAPYGARRVLPRLCPPRQPAPPISPFVWIGAGFVGFSAGSAQGFGDNPRISRGTAPFSHLQLAHFTWNPTQTAARRQPPTTPARAPV